MFGIVALILAIILYLVIAAQNLYDGEYCHAGLWVSYSLANVFLLIWEIDKYLK